jgi:hypothetical protein
MGGFFDGNSIHLTPTNGKINQDVLAHEIAHAIRFHFLQNRNETVIPYKAEFNPHNEDYYNRLSSYDGNSNEVQQMKDIYGKYVDTSNYRKSERMYDNMKDVYDLSESFADHAKSRASL